MFYIDQYTGDCILPNFGQVTFHGEIPEYITGINYPLSVDAEMSFECDINMPAYAKIMGIDLSHQSDITAASVLFKSPYKIQNRRHKKKRINKKWAKRYGYSTKFKSYQITDVHFEQRDRKLEIIGSDVRMIY